MSEKPDDPTDLLEESNILFGKGNGGKFKLTLIPGSGRGLVACQDILPGEIIHQEEPSVVGVVCMVRDYL